MRLIDTSAWIEHLVGTETGKLVAPILPPREIWVVPTIIQLELAKWLSREVDEDTADRVIAFTELCVVVPLDTRIALAAANACRSHKLATADAIVWATATEMGAELVTCDAHFVGLDGVRYVPKSPS